MNRLICLCSGIRENEILEALKNIDKPSLKMVQEKTGAASNCGRCITSIEAMLEKHKESIEVID